MPPASEDLRHNLRQSCDTTCSNESAPAHLAPSLYHPLPATTTSHTGMSRSRSGIAMGTSMTVFGYSLRRKHDMTGSGYCAAKTDMDSSVKPCRELWYAFHLECSRESADCKSPLVT